MDFYIFLTYYRKDGEHSPSPFEHKFVIIQTSDLQKLIEKAKKKAGKKGVFSFYFNFEGNQVVEKRGIVTDYSNYLNNWDLIQQALEE